MIAPLAELVDAADLGSVIERCESSSLLGGTIYKHITNGIAFSKARAKVVSLG